MILLRVQHLKQQLLVHCSSHFPHPTHEQCMALRVITAKVLLHPQWFFYVPIGDKTTISTWLSEPHEGLTICRCNLAKAAPSSLVILRPQVLV